MLDRARERNQLRRALQDLALSKWRASVPRVAEICTEYERLAREEKDPEPPPPRVPGPYSFVSPVVVLPADYKDLDAVSKAQYRVAAGSTSEAGRRRTRVTSSRA